jgi:hypothetical protein
MRSLKRTGDLAHNGSQFRDLVETGSKDPVFFSRQIINDHLFPIG